MSAYPSKAHYRKAWTDAFTSEPPVPLNVDIEMASACNARCGFCLYGDSDWYQGMAEKDWDGKAKRRFMDPDLAMRLIDEASALGVPALKMNFRGESTLHPDFSEIMAYARRAPRTGAERCSCHQFGHHPAFHEILLNTNANCPDASLPGLMCASKVMVSLDSMVPETYAKIRVGLNLDKAMATIDWLVAHGHPDVWVRRVICAENEGEDFATAVKARWPSGVKVSEHYAFDRNKYRAESVHGENSSEWGRTYCGYPSQRVVVESSGRYGACCIAWNGELSGGTFPALSLKAYWESEWRRRLAEDLRAGKIENEKCRNCTSYMSFKRPERDRVQDVEVA